MSPVPFSVLGHSSAEVRSKAKLETTLLSKLPMGCCALIQRRPSVCSMELWASSLSRVFQGSRAPIPLGAGLSDQLLARTRDSESSREELNQDT